MQSERRPSYDLLPVIELKMKRARNKPSNIDWIFFAIVNFNVFVNYYYHTFKEIALIWKVVEFWSRQEAGSSVGVQRKEGRKYFIIIPHLDVPTSIRPKQFLKTTPTPWRLLSEKVETKKFQTVFFSEVHKFAALKKVSFVSCSEFEELLEKIFEK